MAINLWHQKFVNADVTAVLSPINMILSDEDKILIKGSYLKGYTTKRLTDEFPEKSWTKRDVNKQCRTQTQLTLARQWKTAQ